MNLMRFGPTAWATGVLLVLAGVTISAWGAWQVWGTTAVAQGRHASVIEQLEGAWADGPGGGANANEGVVTDFGTATAIVRIPVFGDDYAVPVFEGTTAEVLTAGFGHRTDTAAAGGRGNYVLAAHRVTHGEPLRRMPELKPGDVVKVETPAATYTYVLDTAGDALTVTDRDTWVTEPVPDPGPAGFSSEVTGDPGSRRLLTLITCADFTRSPNRLVAFGHLVDVDDSDRTD